MYLEEGDKEYKNKEAFNAIFVYTKGLQVNCKDDELNAKLYCNRAKANFHLGSILFLFLFYFIFFVFLQFLFIGLE